LSVRILIKLSLAFSRRVTASSSKISSVSFLQDIIVIDVSATSSEDGVLMSGMAIDGETVVARFNEYEEE
jgi:hypothetical protein